MKCKSKAAGPDAQPDQQPHNQEQPSEIGFSQALDQLEQGDAPTTPIAQLTAALRDSNEAHALGALLAKPRYKRDALPTTLPSELLPPLP